MFVPNERAAVLFEGIWRFVYGKEKMDDGFVFLLNGRVEKCPCGRYDIYHSSGTSDEDIQNDVIQLNIYILSKE